MSAGWRRNSNSVTIPKSPPPRSPRNRSGFCDWLACRISPLADTTSKRPRCHRPGRTAGQASPFPRRGSGRRRRCGDVAGRGGQPGRLGGPVQGAEQRAPAPGPGAGPGRPGQRPPGTGQSSGRCQAPLGREYCGLLPGPQANHLAGSVVTVRTCRVSLSAFRTTAVTSWTAATACSRSCRPMPPVSARLPGAPRRSPGYSVTASSCETGPDRRAGPARA